MFRNLSVRTKLRLIVTLTSAAALTLACVVFLVYDLKAARDSEVRNLNVLSAVFAKEANVAVAFRDADGAQDILRNFGVNPQLVLAAVYTADGKPLAAWHRQDVPAGAIPPHPGADGVRFVDQDLEAAAPVVQEENRIGTLYIKSSLTAMRDRVVTNVLVVLLALLGSTLLAYILASSLDRVITGPVLHLADTVRAVSKDKNYAVRATAESGDELGVLIGGFNEMLAQIQGRDDELRRGRDELERRVHKRTRELKVKDEQLRQSQKMEAIGRLAGGVAHDFNNLLSAIIGFAELAALELPENAPQRRYLDEIRKAGDRAAALTRQLLAFSRKQVLQAEIIDVNALVTDMDKMLRRIIGEQVSLETALDPSAGLVKADRGQIEQVLMNLVINARDAMTGGGKLLIKTSNCQLDASLAQRGETVPSGPAVMISVSDNGAGMDENVLSHIFEPFFTTKERGRGTGLGLSTVYGIVKQSGGHIWVQSHPGEGAIFRIYLPRVEEAARPKSGLRRLPLRSRGDETVLVVEDEERVRALVKQLLAMNGYSVLEAANGSDALTVLRGHAGRINLLLTDVVMPSMGGRELVEQACALRPDLKVMYMSGYTDDQIVHTGVLDAKVPFLQKPFSPDVLALKVREVIDEPSPELPAPPVPPVKAG